MIVLKISNASEVVASKVGRFLERLTPDSIDQTTVEDQVIKKLIENLAAEGLKGEVAAIAATSPFNPSAAKFSINFLITWSSTVVWSMESGVRRSRNRPTFEATTSEALEIFRTIMDEKLLVASSR